MTSSRVTLGPQSNPDQYIGRVTSLAGSDLAASVSDGAGSRLSVVARLQIASGTGSATASVIVTSGGSP
jgi:hypothetical protein